MIFVYRFWNILRVRKPCKISVFDGLCRMDVRIIARSPSGEPYSLVDLSIYVYLSITTIRSRNRALYIKQHINTHYIYNILRTHCLTTMSHIWELSYKKYICINTSKFCLQGDPVLTQHKPFSENVRALSNNNPNNNTNAN